MNCRVYSVSLHFFLKECTPVSCSFVSHSFHFINYVLLHLHKYNSKFKVENTIPPKKTTPRRWRNDFKTLTFLTNWFLILLNYYRVETCRVKVGQTWVNTKQPTSDWLVTLNCLRFTTIMQVDDSNFQQIHSLRNILQKTLCKNLTWTWIKKICASYINKCIPGVVK